MSGPTVVAIAAAARDALPVARDIRKRILEAAVAIDDPSATTDDLMRLYASLAELKEIIGDAGRRLSVFQSEIFFGARPSERGELKQAYDVGAMRARLRLP